MTLARGFNSDFFSIGVQLYAVTSPCYCGPGVMSRDKISFADDLSGKHSKST